jgi:hypothetical protein
MSCLEPIPASATVACNHAIRLAFRA